MGNEEWLQEPQDLEVEANRDFDDVDEAINAIRIADLVIERQPYDGVAVKERAKAARAYLLKWAAQGEERQGMMTQAGG